MKKILTILLFFASHFSSYGQGHNNIEIVTIGLTPNSRISLQLNSLRYSTEGDNLKIETISTQFIDEIYGDTIRNESNKVKNIPLKDSAGITSNFTCYQYGGKGDFFYNNIKKHNPSLAEKDDFIKRIITRGENDNGDIKIECCYADLFADTLVLKFSKAYHAPTYTIKNDQNKWDGWYPCDKNFYVVKIYKYSTAQEIAKENTHIDSQGVEEITDESKKEKEEDVNKKGESLLGSLLIFDSNWFILIVSILIIIALIIAIFIHVNKLSKKIKDLKVSKDQSSSKSEEINIDKIKLAVISKIQSKDLVQRISNEDIYNVVNRSDIQLYIQNIIAGKVEDYLRNKVNISIPSNNSNSHQQPLVVQPELRTTKIEYRADNNCFIISENSQNKIFEIYSTNGEYYYTIVNDASIKKEMLGFITAFSGYVETRQDSPIPSTVEVLRDGRLIKNGDMYIIDTTSILQVSLK